MKKKKRFCTPLLSSGCTVLKRTLRRKSRKACFSNGTELKKILEEKKCFCTQHLSSWCTVLGGTLRRCFSDKTDLKKKKMKKKASLDNALTFYTLRRIVLTELEHGWLRKKWKKNRFCTQLLSSECTVPESALRRKSRKDCFSNGTELKNKLEGKTCFCTQHFSSWSAVLGGTLRRCFSDNTDLRKEKRKKTVSLDNALTFYTLRTIVLTELEHGTTKNEKKIVSVPNFYPWHTVPGSTSLHVVTSSRDARDEGVCLDRHQALRLTFHRWWQGLRSWSKFCIGNYWTVCTQLITSDTSRVQKLLQLVPIITKLARIDLGTLASASR